MWVIVAPGADVWADTPVHRLRSLGAWLRPQRPQEVAAFWGPSSVHQRNSELRLQTQNCACAISHLHSCNDSVRVHNQ